MKGEGEDGVVGVGEREIRNCPPYPLNTCFACLINCMLRVMAESRFYIGTQVEVSLPDVHCRGAWFPATVLGEIENDLFLVEYNSLRIGGMEEALRDIVDTLHIRPSPPENLPGKEFGVLEEVDAYFDFGWWVGVVTKVLSGNWYVVRLKHLKEWRIYNHIELRSHREWTNGIWCQDSLQDIHAKPNEGNVRETDQPHLPQVGNTVESIDISNKLDTRKRKIKQCPPEPCKKLKEGEVTKNSLSILLAPQRTMHTRSMTRSRTFSDLAITVRKGEEALLQKKTYASPNLTDILSRPLERAQGDSSEPQVQFLQKCLVTQFSPDNTKRLGCDEIIRQKEGLGDQTTDILETGGPSKEMVSEASAENSKHETPSREVRNVVQTECSQGSKINMKETLSNKQEIQPLPMWSEESHSPASLENRGSPDNRLESQSDIAITLREESIKGHEVQRPLCVAKCSMSLGDHTNAIDQFSKAIEDGQNEAELEAFLLDHDSDEVTLEKGNWPFEKSFLFWETVESMEEFHSMPQNPHFQPLQQKNEFFREGCAFRYMLSFANIVKKIQSAQLDEPRNSFVNKLNALVELEAIGLNVQPVRDWLDRLVKFKDKRVELDGELQQVERKINEEKQETESLDLKVDKIDEKLRDLEESISQMKKERQKVVLERQARRSSIVALQERIQEIKIKIQHFNLEYNGVAAAPL